MRHKCNHPQSKFHGQRSPYIVLYNALISTTKLSSFVTNATYRALKFCLPSHCLCPNSQLIAFHKELVTLSILWGQRWITLCNSIKINVYVLLIAMMARIMNSLQKTWSLHVKAKKKNNNKHSLIFNEKVGLSHHPTILKSVKCMILVSKYCPRYAIST